MTTKARLAETTATLSDGHRLAALSSPSFVTLLRSAAGEEKEKDELAPAGCAPICITIEDRTSQKASTEWRQQRQMDANSDATVCSFTEQTHRSDRHDVDGEEDAGGDVTVAADDDDDGHDGDASGSGGESSCWESDIDDGGGGGAGHRRDAPLGRARSTTTLSVQTLSSAFSLDGLGSTWTVSSLEWDDDEHEHKHEYEYAYENGGVGPGEGRRGGSQQRRPVTAGRDDGGGPAAPEDGHSDSASQQRVRRRGQRVDVHDLREVICRPFRRQMSGLAMAGENFVTIDTEEVQATPAGGDKFSAEFDADCDDDGDADALQRTIVRMHATMANANAATRRPGGKRLKLPQARRWLDEATDNVDEEETLVLEDDDGSSSVIDQHSFAWPDAEGNNAPLNLSAAKDFLANLAILPLCRPKGSEPTIEEAGRGRTAPRPPVENHMGDVSHLARRMRVHSRDYSEYTEVLVSSDDSRGQQMDDDNDDASWLGRDEGCMDTSPPTTRHGHDAKEGSFGTCSLVEDSGIWEEDVEEEVVVEEEEYHEEIIEEDEEEGEVIEEEVETR